MLKSPRGLALAIALPALILDQVSKHWALTTLQQAGAHKTLPGPADITLVFNYSNAFGFVPISGELTRWGLAAFNLGAAAFLIYWVARRGPSRLMAAGMAFLIAGALGNAIDRIRFGAVIDFIDASKLGFIWVFNIADASVDIGIAFLLLASVWPRQFR